jgi:serine/threonine protein kinase
MKGVATAFSSANIHDPAWVLSALQSIGMVDPTGSVFLTSIFVAAVFSLIHPDLWRDLSQGWKRIRETAQRKTNSKGDVARIFFEVSKTFLGTFFQRFVGALVFISAIQLPSLSSFTTNTFTNFFVGMTLSYSIHSFANAAILSSSKPNGFIPIHFPRVANILKNIRLFSTTIDVNSFILLVLKQLKNENYIKHIHQELMATFPGYKNEFLREFEESQVNPSTIAAFWTIHSGLSIGEPTNNWKSLKSDLEATGKFEHIDDIPIGRGGFGEVRVCRSNNKEFLIKSVRFEKGTTLLNAIIAIASILIEGDILGKIKDHYRKGEVHHAAPLLIGKALFKGRNIIFQERILGKNGNAVEMGENALTKVERILHSLVELHKIGVVHGDIKPENIIITKEGEAVFIDFGASKLTGQGFLMSDVISTNMYGTTASDFLTGATKSSDVYQMALTLFAFLPTDILTRPDIFPYIKRTISGFPLPDDGVPPGLEKLMYRPSSEELHDAIATAIAHPMKPLSAIEQQGLFNEIRELRFSNSRRGNLVRSKNIKLGGNNFAFYFLRLFLSEQIAAKWSMRLLPLEISGLGWAGWFATGWAHTVLSGAVAFDPTLMGVLLMAGGILAFRGLHLGLDRLWYAKNPGQGPPSKDFWSNTARMMPYAMLPILTSSPVVFLVAFSVLAYDHFAFDLKRLFNINAPLANATKILVISMVSATFAVAIGPIIVSNLASPMGTFFLVSLAAQALDPGTLQSFSENPASGLIALGIGSVSNFLTYAFAMEWASMVLLGSVTSKLIYNTRQSPLFSFALAGGDSQRMDSSNSTIQTQADRPLNTISDNRGDYESYLISSPHSLLTKGRLERNLQIARQTVGVKSVFYLGAGTDLTHVLTSFPDATHVTLSGNNYGNITAESIKNEMTTTQIPSERTQQFLNTYKDSVLNDYKESVLNHGFAGTSLVQKSSMQSSFLALELLSLGVQTNSLREEHAGEISFEVPGLLGRPPRRVSFILKNNSFSRSPIQMNDGKREFDGFFAKAIDGIQPYYKEIFSALADRFSSSLTVVSDNAIPDNVGDIGFIKTSAFSLSDEDSGSYGNAFQVAKLSRSTLTGQDNNSAALAVISLIETRGLGKIADNLRPFVSAREYRQPFEFSEETTASDIGTAISILEEEDASIKAAEEYGRQWALAEGPNTRMVAVLFKIDSWAQETREIALAVVRGMLSAGKVIVVADERFDTTTIKTENQDKLEIIQVNEITDKFMERVKEIHSGPISKKVLVSEQHSRFLNDEYVAFIIEGLLRAIQNKIDALLAVLRAA